MSLLVRDLIQAARIRHWAFTDVELGDGAALLFLNERQRTHLAAFGPEIEGLIGTTLQYALSRSSTQALIALNGSGTPVYGTTYQDGYAVHLNANGALYIDTAEAPIAGDPFGQSGGTPGFPLPVDFIRLINVALVYTNNTVIPCDVIDERARFTVRPGRNPMAFVSGNRLVPVLPLSTGNTGDRWFSMSAIQIGYVAMRTLASLTDVLTLPMVCCEAMTADLASLFADQSRSCTQAERTAYARKAEVAGAKVAGASNDLLDSVQSSSVHFRP